MIKLRKRNQKGFTLIELLMVILIVGILAAVGLPMYLGYAKDARMSEGKTLLGSLWTAMRGCAQVTPTVPCPDTAQYTRIGVDATTGISPNDQWDIGATGSVTLAADNTYTLTGFLSTVGNATNTNNLEVRFGYAGGVGTFTCSTDGTAPAATDLC